MNLIDSNFRPNTITQNYTDCEGLYNKAFPLSSIINIPKDLNHAIKVRRIKAIPTKQYYQYTQIIQRKAISKRAARYIQAALSIFTIIF